MAIVNRVGKGVVKLWSMLAVSSHYSSSLNLIQFSEEKSFSTAVFSKQLVKNHNKMLDAVLYYSKIF